MGKQLTMIENCAVPDVYVSGLGEIEPLENDMMRFTYFAMDHGERVVVARLITSKQALVDALTMAGKTTATCPCDRLLERTQH